MSRWKASGIHLLISIAVGVCVLALLFGVWYPSPYFAASGGQELLLVLLGVDIVLGPLLTLIVFKSGKKSLRFDLGVIAALQAGALIYGLHVITEARPVFIVWAVDRFTVVAANQIDPKDLAEGGRPEFRSLAWTGPRIVAARLPSDSKERTDLAFSGLAGKDVESFPRYYVDYASEVPTLLLRARPLADLRRRGERASREIDAWLAAHGRAESAVVWLPVLARHASVSMLLDAQSGTPLAALAIDPW